MGIIGKKESEIRQYLLLNRGLAAGNSHNFALADLHDSLDVYVSRLVNSIKHAYNESSDGVISRVTAFMPEKLMPLESSRRAKSMLLKALKEKEPNTASVEFDILVSPDETDRYFRAIITFDPPLSYPPIQR